MILDDSSLRILRGNRVSFQNQRSFDRVSFQNQQSFDPVSFQNQRSSNLVYPCSRIPDDGSLAVTGSPLMILDRSLDVHNDDCRDFLDGSLDENNRILDNCSWTPSEVDRSLDTETHNDEMSGSLQIVGFQSDEICAEDMN
jgi:hypothetical protein